MAGHSMEVAMSTLNKSTKTARLPRLLSLSQMKQGLANWSRRARSRKELMNLSDRCLNDIGIARHSSGLKSCKPFWMA
jgi:uncharacterized protein YjiS (DUF1127 family)